MLQSKRSISERSKHAPLHPRLLMLSGYVEKTTYEILGKLAFMAGSNGVT